MAKTSISGRFTTKRYSFFISFVFSLFGAGCTTVEINRDRYSGLVFRDQLSVGIEGPEMVWIPSGFFRMGNINNDFSDGDEIPVHKVKIPHPFALAKFETTVAEFRQFVEKTGYRTIAEVEGGCRARKDGWRQQEGSTWYDPFFKQEENHPIVCVSWGDAVAYTKWLSQQTGKEYRLPTEAEWEYAVRGGTETTFWWGERGDCQKARCRFFFANWKTIRTVAVGSYLPNPFGLYDVYGNVWEWVASEYVAPYDGSEQKISGKALYEGVRVIRGGAWYNYIRDLRSSNRGAILPYEAWSTVGFRVARNK